MLRILTYIKRGVIWLLIVLSAAYAATYTVLGITSVQKRVADYTENSLSSFLGSKVSIGSIRFYPLDRVVINDITLFDKKGGTLFYADKAGLSIALGDIVFGKLTFYTISVKGFCVNITKEDETSKTNIQFLIDKFSNNSGGIKPKIKISTLLLQGGTLKYNVLDKPNTDTGKFDKNHIVANNILVNASLKEISKDSLNINLRQFRFDESNGFSIEKFAFKLIGNTESIMLKNFLIETKNSVLSSQRCTIDITKVKDLNSFIDNAELNIAVGNSKAILSDFSTFLPAVKQFKIPITFNFILNGTISHLNLDEFEFNYGKGLIYAKCYGNIDNILPKIDKAFLFGKVETIEITSEGIIKLSEELSKKLKNYNIIRNIGDIYFSGEISGFISKLVTFGVLKTAIGIINADMLLAKDKGFYFKGGIKSDSLKLDRLLPGKNLRSTGFALKLDGRSSGYNNSGKVSGKISNLEYLGYKYGEISLDGSYSGKAYKGSILLNDSNATFSMEGEINLSKKDRMLMAKIRGEGIRLNELRLTKKYSGSVMDFDIDADFTGTQIDNADGEIRINKFSFLNNDTCFSLDSATISANNSTYPQIVEIKSNILNGKLQGKFSFMALKSGFSAMLSEVAPSLLERVENRITDNNFTFDFYMPNTTLLSQAFELPVTLSKESSINGYYDDATRRFSLIGDIPSITAGKINLKGNTIKIEKFSEAIQLDVQTAFLSRKGTETAFNIYSVTTSDSTDLNIEWQHEKPKVFNGKFSSTTHFIKSEDGNLFDIIIRPTDFTVNDSIWHILPSTIFVNGQDISIHDFEIGRDRQYLQINGDIGKQEDKQLGIKLKEIDLSYIFDVLNRKNIVFGGEATGNVFVNGLTSGEPQISTRALSVKDFSYNDCIFGNLSLDSQWENEKRAILLNGIVSNPNIASSKILGRVFLREDSLSFSFDAHKLGLSFLRPFTENILDNLDGKVSGAIDFYGKFKALNVSGDAYVENFNFGVNYLNTNFSISDSVHMNEKEIWTKNAKLKDAEGNSGLVSMSMKHKNFRNLSYNIDISQLNNFLVFNVTERLNPIYFGKVYGSGGGLIRGNNKTTDIDVNMRTNARSKFTYVLSNEASAGDYKFITYVDKDAVNEWIEESFENRHTTKKDAQDILSHKIKLNLQIDATPNALMELVIDPNTRDIIKANGEGGIRIEYSTNNNIKIYGTYTVEKGSYNFNLQDLIAKEFVVNPGSSIMFRGDPKNAEMNLSAYYSLQANLLDLDESFAQDRELNRTTVTVHTTLMLTGDLNRPELKFDLNFPTLNQDIYRRVKTIVSTEDMMNRQVLYLLGLGKFYTPDYMNVGQTHNNELASVASSALSSQLNNILGQISDKVNIGTNFRSDKGDFSDIEFDVALSSQLLNNRLIFNGNLGYRDKSVNSNSFIGDFDLEYLLNKSGTFRLKAYNHYNDKNYYIKSALTTQGVGIMFKKDFTKAKEIFQRTLPKREKRVKGKDKNITDKQP